MTVQTCPECVDGHILPVMYGMPLSDDLEREDVIIAGCVLPSFHVPNPVACNNPECEWSGGVFDQQLVHDTVFMTAQHAIDNYLKEEPIMVDPDMLNRMTTEITLGYTWGDPRSRVPQTEEHHQAWLRLEQQVTEIKARGHIVDIPHDWPDLDDYTPGTI